MRLSGLRLLLGLRVETRTITRPTREVRRQSHTFFKAVDVLCIIPDQTPTIPERSDEPVGLGGVCDFLGDLLPETGDEHVEY